MKNVLFVETFEIILLMFIVIYNFFKNHKFLKKSIDFIEKYL